MSNNYLISGVGIAGSFFFKKIKLIQLTIGPDSDGCRPKWRQPERKFSILLE